MPRQIYLTESGFFFVTQNILTDPENHPYNKMDYAQFLRNRDNNNLNIDYNLTDLLNKEFPPQSFPFRRRTFKNGLSDLPDSPQIENHTVLFEYKPIADNDYLMMIQKLGYTIDKDIRDIYVGFDDWGSMYFQDKNHFSKFDDDYYLASLAFVQSQDLFMNFNMHRYIFKKEDYQKYLEIKEETKKDSNYLNTLEDKDYHLYLDINQMISQQNNLPLIVAHESKHQKNRFLRERRQLKDNAKKLSCEDIFRINVEDERSAVFAEIITTINNYFKTKDDTLLKSCCESYSWLKNLLQGKTPEETKNILSDYTLLLNKSLEHWNKTFAESYLKQFRNLCPQDAQNYISLPDDVNHEEYNKQRSLFYSFDVYNPETGKTETKDFSKLINVDVIIEKEEREIIDFSKKLRKDMSELYNDPEVSNTLLNIIQQAKEMLKEKIHVMDNLEETRLDGPQEEKDTSEKTPLQSETNSQPQTNPQTETENQSEIKEETRLDGPQEEKDTSEKTPLQSETNSQPQTNPQIETENQSEIKTKPETKPQKGTEPKISVEENITEPENKTSPKNKPHNKGFAEPYRKFYKDIAKQENSQYSEDENSPHYKATLTRKNGEELNIVATSENKICLSSKDKNKKPKVPDYKDFNDLALLAKKNGRKITFGDIKSSEFKARLMIACLENDIEMNNLPNVEELKDIEQETKERLRKQKDKIKERIIANKQRKNPDKETQDKEKRGQSSIPLFMQKEKLSR